MVSLKDGLGGPVVLLENPEPGRAVAVGSGFFGELGLSGAFSRSLRWVASRVAMVASAFAGHITAKAQKVDLIPSRTLGFASARPFRIHFSIMSAPPPCSRIR